MLRVCYGDWMTRSATVIMKARPVPMAMSLSRVLSIAMSLRIPVLEERNSEVMRRIMAVTASQRPMSEVVRGKFIVLLRGFVARFGLFLRLGLFGFFGLLPFFRCFGLLRR